MDTKQCSRCSETKPLEQFPPDKRARDGRASHCRVCQGKAKKAWTDKQSKNPSARKERIAQILSSGLKACSKCAQVKTLDQFYKDKRNGDGLSGHCIECHYKMTRAYEQSEHGKAVISKAKREAYYKRGGKDKARTSNATPKAKAQRIVYAMSEAGREAQRRKDAKRQQTSPEKNRARRVVRDAVASGVLPPVNTLKCAHCANMAEEYHHVSYAEEDFLRVTPLCKTCHAKTYTTTYE